MANTIHHLDLANLFVGDDDPTASLFLVLNNVTLPNLQEKTKTYEPGGSVMSIDVGLRKMDPLRMPFQLEGLNPDVMPRFMPAGSQRINYTLRANVRDVKTHEDIPLKAIVQGRMIKANLGQIGGNDGIQSDYEVAEIFKYQLWLGNTEKFYFDFLAGPAGVRIDGVNPYQTVAANLGII